MVVHEGLFAAFGPFIIPVILFAFGGIVYVVLWWFGRARVGESRSQR